MEYYLFIAPGVMPFCAETATRNHSAVSTVASRLWQYTNACIAGPQVGRAALRSTTHLSKSMEVVEENVVPV